MQAIRSTPQELKAWIINIRKTLRRQKREIPPVRITIRRPWLMRAYVLAYLKSEEALELSTIPKHPPFDVTIDAEIDVFVDEVLADLGLLEPYTVTELAHPAAAEEDEDEDLRAHREENARSDTIKALEMMLFLAADEGKPPPIAPAWSPEWDEKLLPGIRARLLQLTRQHPRGVYVRARMTFVNPNGQPPINERTGYEKIRHDDIEKYIVRVRNDIFKYAIGSVRGFAKDLITDEYHITPESEMWFLKHVDIESMPNTSTRSTIHKVAAFSAENCVISVIRSCIGDRTDAVYKRFPILAPDEWLAREAEKREVDEYRYFTEEEMRILGELAHEFITPPAECYPDEIEADIKIYREQQEMKRIITTAPFTHDAGEGDQKQIQVRRSCVYITRADLCRVAATSQRRNKVRGDHKYFSAEQMRQMRRVRDIEYLVFDAEFGFDDAMITKLVMDLNFGRVTVKDCAEPLSGVFIGNEFAHCLAKFVPSTVFCIPVRARGTGLIYINDTEMDALAKLLQVELRIFTDLGVKLGAKKSDTWMQLGRKGKKIIPIKVQNEHATIVPLKMPPRAVIYEDKIEIPSATNVIDFGKDRDDVPLFYTAIEHGVARMHKTFRPSSVDKRCRDDDPAFHYVFETDQLLFQLFKKDNDLTVIEDEDVRNIVRAAEMFIGCRRICPIPVDQKCTEVDHNAHYCSYETSPYYMGFPTNNLVPCKLQYAVKPAYYVTSRIDLSNCAVGYQFIEFYCSHLVNDVLESETVEEFCETIEVERASRVVTTYIDRVERTDTVVDTLERTSADTAGTFGYVDIRRGNRLDLSCADDEVEIIEFSRETHTVVDTLCREEHDEIVTEYIEKKSVVKTIVSTRPDCVDVPMVLPTPMYNCLIKHGAVIDVEYVLDVDEFKHISVLDYANKFDLTPAEKKSFRNTLIGRTITGGVAEKKKIRCEFFNTDERDHMLFEAQEKELGIDGDVDAERGTLIFTVDKIPKALFNFHSFIVSYAGVYMMEKWLELAQAGHQVVAYNVDALMVRGDYSEPEITTEPGKWKTSEMDPRYYGMHMDRHNARERFFLPVINVPDKAPLHKNVLEEGAAGVGKSHKYKVDPYYDQIICTPTHELRIEHSAVYPDTYTAHKIFQFGASDEQFEMLRKRGDIPRRHAVYVIDEYTMFNTREWEIIIRRSCGARIIALGDPEQIRKAVDGSPITQDFFRSRGWDIIETVRTPDLHARHEYEYGCALDDLRGLTYEEQCHQIYDSTLWMGVMLDRLFVGLDLVNTRVIVGNHKRAYELNNMAREYAQKYDFLFPFVSTAKPTIYREKRYENMCVHTDKVFWDRKSMDDVRPKGTKWEPYFAVTADSFQGKTTPDNMLVVVDTVTLSRHGTLYTAMTRSRRADSIRILNLGNWDFDINDPDVEAALGVEYPPIDPDIMALIDAAEVPEEVEYAPEPVADLPPYEPRHPLCIKKLSTLPPREHRSLKTVPRMNFDNQTFSFVVRSEFPYDRYLEFRDATHFANWAAAQPMEERCYHEVVLEDWRKFVIDIDKGDPDTDYYVALFKRLFSDMFHVPCTDNDIALIDSTGFSNVLQCEKYSIQIRTRYYWSNAYTCQSFANAFRRHVKKDKGNERARRVDVAVYKKNQCFRTVGSTKKDDKRWSRTTAGLLDTFVNPTVTIHRPDDAPFVEFYLPWDLNKHFITHDFNYRINTLGDHKQIVVKEIKNEHTERIRVACAPYVEKCTMQASHGRISFLRHEPGYCHMCKREHDRANMFIRHDDESYFLCCWGGGDGRKPADDIKLFEYSDKHKEGFIETGEDGAELVTKR